MTEPAIWIESGPLARIMETAAFPGAEEMAAIVDDRAASAG
jgi:hypothetical protein